MSNETGEELWRIDMRAGATATPMSYIGAESGDQFVALTAGGTFQTGECGDSRPGEAEVAISTAGYALTTPGWSGFR